MIFFCVDVNSLHLYGPQSKSMSKMNKMSIFQHGHIKMKIYGTHIIFSLFFDVVVDLLSK